MDGEQRTDTVDRLAGVEQPGVQPDAVAFGGGPVWGASINLGWHDLPAHTKSYFQGFS
jgi:hypothetical protein